MDAVTHARFMGTDLSSDGVTLFRVVEVLHTLMKSPEGSALTNEAVCEVMLSCFKICFEPRLNELLRRSAEQALKDMVLLLFMRLPQFADDRSEGGLLKKFQMMAASMEQNKKTKPNNKNGKSTLHRSVSQRSVDQSSAKAERKTSASALLSSATEKEDPQSPQNLNVGQLKVPPLATTPASPAGNIVDLQGKITQTPTTALESALNTQESSSAAQQNAEMQQPVIEISASSPEQQADVEEQEDASVNIANAGSSEYINSVGVRFTQQNSVDGSEGMSSLLPYGLPCIQELFRFLILLCNPHDKQNTDTMMHMGLSLLTVAFEVGADNIGKYDTLLELVKDDLCRNLIAVSLNLLLWSLFFLKKFAFWAI